MVGGAPDEAVHVWRFHERGCAVRMPGEVLTAMREMAANSRPRETGGTLVGHYSEDLQEAFVTAALEADIGARKQRARFYRPPDDVDRQLARIYEESGGAYPLPGRVAHAPRRRPNPQPHGPGHPARPRQVEERRHRHAVHGHPRGKSPDKGRSLMHFGRENRAYLNRSLRAEAGVNSGNAR